MNVFFVFHSVRDRGEKLPYHVDLTSTSNARSTYRVS